MQIDPSATPAEIKSAFRKLAHAWHPDKNEGNRESQAQFQLVKEAYETLTQPALRKKYLEKRWLHQAGGIPYTNELRTPENILQRFLDFYRQLAVIDEHRMDKKGFYENFSALLSAERIAVLNEFADTKINREIIFLSTEIAGILRPADRLLIFEQLKTLAGGQLASQRIAREQRQTRRLMLRNRFFPLMIALLVLLLCALVWFAGKA